MNTQSAPDTETTPTKPKTMHPQQLREHFYNLSCDWILLHDTLPTTPRPEGRPAKTREYGHPAEWASDTAAHIVNILTSWHDLMAEHRNETPPPKGNEERRLTTAWKYLEPRCEQLTQLVTATDLKELPDLHHRIRRTLGYTKNRDALPIPCPNDDCHQRKLFREQGITEEYICCDNCGYTTKWIHYGILIRITLDALLANCTDTVTPGSTTMPIS